MVINMATMQKMTKFKSKFSDFKAIFVSTVGAGPDEHARELVVFKMDANTSAVYKMAAYKKVNYQILLWFFPSNNMLSNL